MNIRGAVLILSAAFVWGIGNAVTGWTAQEYFTDKSLLPGVDIALANTFGGLLFLMIAYLSRNLFFRHNSEKKRDLSNLRKALISQRTVFSGTLKGLNTCFFVFSTTYIVATQSLIFESTYILWALFITVLFVTRKLPGIFTIAQVALLSVAVVLVSGEINFEFDGRESMGIAFGLGAGLSYAFFLYFWSGVTEKLSDITSQLISTMALLIISFLTIMILIEFISLAFLQSLWIPFANLKYQDVGLQLLNGVFVVGAVYLLITIGMANLRNVGNGASFVTTLGLSFSIPFTLLPEYILGKFVPTILQISGIILFMIVFSLLSVSTFQEEKANL